MLNSKIFENHTGKLERTGSSTFVTVRGDMPWLADDGAELTNPKSAPESHEWRKEFNDKEIFFPDEYDAAVSARLNAENSFVLSLNGYFSIKPDQERAYGVSSGAYEAACVNITKSVIGFLISEFPGVHVRLIDGASDMGVDRAIQSVAAESGLIALGFSCPEYLPYVKDGNGLPVYVAADQPDYSSRYVQSLDFLITTGGRQQALTSDLNAVFVHKKKIHVIDVLSILSPHGPVPATKEANGKVVVDNAAAAIVNSLTHYAIEGGSAVIKRGRDQWPVILDDVCSVAAAVCRGKLTPDAMFNQPERYSRIFKSAN